MTMNIISSTRLWDFEYITSIALKDSYLYIGGYDPIDWLGMWQVWDISDSEYPTDVATIYETDYEAVMDIAINGDRIYLACPNYVGTDAIKVYDISDPENPSYVTKISGKGSPNYLEWVCDLFIEDDKLYALGYFEDPNSIVIFDISNPNQITKLGHTLDTVVQTGWGTGLFECGVKNGYLYVLGDSFGTLMSYGCTNPASIVRLKTSSTYDDYLDGPHHLHIKDDTTIAISNSYQSAEPNEWRSFVSTWDVTDPSDFYRLDTFPEDMIGGGSPNYVDPGDCEIYENYLFTTDYDDGALTVLDISTPSDIIKAESLVDSGLVGLFLIEIGNGCAYILSDMDNWEPTLIICGVSEYAPTGCTVQVGDNVLVTPSYDEKSNLTCFKGGDIKVGTTVRLYPVKDGESAINPCQRKDDFFLFW